MEKKRKSFIDGRDALNILREAFTSRDKKTPPFSGHIAELQKSLHGPEAHTVAIDTEKSSDTLNETPPLTTNLGDVFKRAKQKAESNASSSTETNPSLKNGELPPEKTPGENATLHNAAARILRGETPLPHEQEVLENELEKAGINEEVKTEKELSPEKNSPGISDKERNEYVDRLLTRMRNGTGKGYGQGQGAGPGYEETWLRGWMAEQMAEHANSPSIQEEIRAIGERALALEKEKKNADDAPKMPPAPIPETDSKEVVTLADHSPDTEEDKKETGNNLPETILITPENIPVPEENALAIVQDTHPKSDAVSEQVDTPMEEHPPVKEGLKKTEQVALFIQKYDALLEALETKRPTAEEQLERLARGIAQRTQFNVREIEQRLADAEDDGDKVMYEKAIELIKEEITPDEESFAQEHVNASEKKEEDIPENIPVPEENALASIAKKTEHPPEQQEEYSPIKKEDLPEKPLREEKEEEEKEKEEEKIARLGVAWKALNEQVEEERKKQEDAEKKRRTDTTKREQPLDPNDLPSEKKEQTDTPNTENITAHREQPMSHITPRVEQVFKTSGIPLEHIREIPGYEKLSEGQLILLCRNIQEMTVGFVHREAHTQFEQDANTSDATKWLSEKMESFIDTKAKKYPWMEQLYKGLAIGSTFTHFLGNAWHRATEDVQLEKRREHALMNKELFFNDPTTKNHIRILADRLQEGPDVIIHGKNIELHYLSENIMDPYWEKLPAHDRIKAKAILTSFNKSVWKFQETPFAKDKEHKKEKAFVKNRDKLLAVI